MAKQQIKQKGKVFRDPVHRLIRIEPQEGFVLDLINTPEFQRLRRVRQLGVSSLTYHGAEHSRFVHSLGVFNFAQRIIAALTRRYGATHEVSRHLEEHSRVIKAAALLHDLGHGPFSHMIERAGTHSFDHERMTAKLITSDGRLRATLEDHNIDAQKVANVIDKTYPYRLIVDIVSSQLDADRMDYLLRDSLMTGVEYGVFDSEWLLNAMCVGQDPDSTIAEGESGDKTWRLCLDRERGLYAAEQLILARHHMMLQVYMHRVTRGYEVMLLNVFRRVSALASDPALPRNTPEEVQAYFRDGINMPLADWVLFDETALVSAIQAWSKSDDRWLARMASAYLLRERIMKAVPLRTARVETGVRLQKELANANLQENIDWGLDNGEHLPYKGILYTAAKQGGDEEKSAVSILLNDGDPRRRGKAVETESDIFQRLDNDRQQLSRLYIDQEKMAAAEPLLERLGLLREA